MTPWCCQSWGSSAHLISADCAFKFAIVLCHTCSVLDCCKLCFHHTATLNHPCNHPWTLVVLAGAAPDGSPQFKYIWSPAYRAMQSAFETAQGSHDPNAIAALLQQCPYHVDCLLAMYDLHRAMGEGQYAEEVLSRWVWVGVGAAAAAAAAA